MEKKIYNIGVEVTMDVIGGKWKPIILCNLRHGEKRPSELLHLIPNISQKMLNQELKELQQDNIVDRTVYNQVPLKVVYSLSDYGQTLGTILTDLCDWGTMHAQTLESEGKNIELLEKEI
ncbi:winged helix-turn-helix transcriptional regulator [Companilactobacillus sp.]|jgi:DNA-binding HxlR family transcriptional regulator|uniref:winged helix-turn-helix transcriptional regulator n=1 Tax=Companilactobacillus sp. TaxID=2767905 RepID=UPI0025B8491B|nr:helix-turn-helix domain-containing protein [Companilactobacillus sp.]MCH4009658.1 helix-turn-helix transcriptional regulator [Companilactobacillus sp.]MCH4052666.1 helix-turn-helix transcriptional regulator [Companilactobacillus sp.]MCH4077600.1 helix-turn-helix transcriptional regulator [Companilactobacillus sp.]MCH4126176.1 helix-turn-helix transcriptional regulator [Companilactobacillus sp.]MCI1311884.1 helix-turn-helix transcriptional regulator [Companilactobacillus sp.]